MSLRRMLVLAAIVLPIVLVISTVLALMYPAPDAAPPVAPCRAPVVDPVPVTTVAPAPLPAPAPAAPTPRQRARAHFEAGRRLYNAGMDGDPAGYVAAHREFCLARDLGSPSAQTWIDACEREHGVLTGRLVRVNPGEPPPGPSATFEGGAAAAPPPDAEIDPGDELAAIFAARDAVEGRLKAPGTARFSGWLFPDEVVMPMGGDFRGCVKVLGWVDAENSFGALLRSDYQCIMMPVGDRWVVIDVSID